MSTPEFDPIRLEVQWDRLSAATDEAASTMLRTAFSTVIRESNDYTVVIMNRRGETMAESRAGIPAFAALFSTLVAGMLERFPVETWQPGDCVITNDPWIATGHLPDISMVCPIFHRDELVGFTGTAAHSPDIGGTPSLQATDLTAEGLLIPTVHLYRGGTLNEDLRRFFLANVRLPAQVWGDLRAQEAAHTVCWRRAVEFLDDFDLDDFEEFSRAIHELTNSAMRRAVAALPDGVYRSSLDADGVPDHPTHLECSVRVAGEHITIDYAGSSGQIPYSTNCTLNYTRAYSIYPLKILLDPSTRTNYGSYRCIEVAAPPGSIVNPTFPAPVAARHLTGHLLSCLLYNALAPLLPDRVIADSGGAPALRVRFHGTDDDGRPFALMLFASAGMGASQHADGLSTTAFPTNSGAGSIEALESSSPLRFRRKEYRTGSGGVGRFRGGLGQDIEVENPTRHPVRVTLLGDRERHPALGLAGGGPGATAQAVRDDGEHLPLKSITMLQPNAAVTLSFAGGGGFGDSDEREPALIAEDILNGFVSGEATSGASSRQSNHEVGVQQ